MNKLKQRWNITSNFQFFIIILVFAITGSTSALIAKPILTFIGITKESISLWLYYPLYIIIILPIYKVILLLIGSLAGQKNFFWNFIKKMLDRMGLGFIHRIFEKENQ
jgi:hypothetical protein